MGERDVTQTIRKYAKVYFAFNAILFGLAAVAGLIWYFIDPFEGWIGLLFLAGAPLLIAWAYFVSRIIDIFADIYDNIKKTAEYQKESAEYLKYIHRQMSGSGVDFTAGNLGSQGRMATGGQDKDTGTVNAPITGQKVYETITADNNPPAINIVKIGEKMTFGAYEQDNNTTNGKEAIEWLVIEKTKSHALLISKYCLDCRPYHDTDEDITWENCSLRAWLNNSFLNTAFSDEEQNKIAVTKLNNPDNPEYGTAGGNSTSDKVFLLSVDEAKQYLANASSRLAITTNYAKEQGAGVIDNGNCPWWLRSPGTDQGNASTVYDDGNVYYDSAVSDPTIGVRPAIWVNL